MMHRRERFSFWAKRDIESLEESSNDQDQDLQGLSARESGSRRPFEAGAAPWSTLHNPPPRQEESRQ